MAVLQICERDIPGRIMLADVERGLLRAEAVRAVRDCSLIVERHAAALRHDEAGCERQSGDNVRQRGTRGHLASARGTRPKIGEQLSLVREESVKEKSSRRLFFPIDSARIRLEQGDSVRRTVKTRRRRRDELRRSAMFFDWSRVFNSRTGRVAVLCKVGPRNWLRFRQQNRHSGGRPGVRRGGRKIAL